MKRTLSIMALLVTFSCTSQVPTFSPHEQRSVAIVKFEKDVYIRNVRDNCKDMECVYVSNYVKLIFLKNDAAFEPFELQVMDLLTGKSKYIFVYPTDSKKDVYYVRDTDSIFGDTSFYDTVAQ